jgi:hypothetical protein
MRLAGWIGILLIVLGVFSIAQGGFTYKKREKVVDIGPIEATATERKTVPVPPPLGAIALIGGIVLVVVGTRRSAA